MWPRTCWHTGCATLGLTCSGAQPMGMGNHKGSDAMWRGALGWGSPLGSFWCCYGSGVESMAKLADSLFFWRCATLHPCSLTHIAQDALPTSPAHRTPCTPLQPRDQQPGTVKVAGTHSSLCTWLPASPPWTLCAGSC